MAQRDLSKRAGLFIGAQFLATTIGTLTWMLLARSLSKPDMASYRLLMYTYTFLSGILILGLPSCLTYFYPTVEEKYRTTTVYIVVAGLLVLGGTLSAVTWFGAPTISAIWNKGDMAGFFRKFCLFYTFTMGSAYMKRLLVSTNRYRVLVFWTPFDRAVNLAAFAVPAAMGYNFQAVVTIGVWVTGAKFAVALLYTLAAVSPAKFAWSGELFRRMLFYAVPLGLSVAVGGMSRQVDTFIIGRYELKEFVATYSFAAQHLPFVPVIPMSVMTVLIPVLAKLHKERDYGQFMLVWHEAIRKTAIFILGAFAFLQFFAEPYIVTLYSAKYAGSVPFFQLYQFTLLYRVTLFGYVLQSMGKPRLILHITLGSFTFKALASCFLYWILGPAGPPVSSALTGLLLSFVYLRSIGGNLGVGLGGIWPWRTYLKNVAAAVAAGFVASAVYWVPPGVILKGLAWAPGLGIRAARLIPSEGLSAKFTALFERLGESASLVTFGQLVLGMAVFVPVYVLLLVLLRTLRKKDWELFRRMTYGRFVKERPGKEAVLPADEVFPEDDLREVP